MNTKTLLQDGDISKGAKDDEELIFDPYNPNNKEITQRQVEIFLKKYGVPDKVHNLNLYKRAFVHRSYVKRPHLPDGDGKTPVYKAAEEGYDGCLKQLIAAGADVNTSDKQGKTPLDSALGRETQEQLKAAGGY